MKKKRIIRNTVVFCVIFILVLVAMYGGLRILESTVFHNIQDAVPPSVSKTITRNGIDYFPRQDLTVMMVLGIHKSGSAENSEANQNNGLADYIMLLVFDERNENIRILNLNPDTMVQMPILGVDGRPAGTNYGQLALSHTYGVGLEDSCENTRKTVSDLLYGVNIDYYLSINMDALPILNDSVGGVTVTVTDDFSAIDPEITKGEFTLHGDQAITFVRSRRDVANQMNISRMERQQEYAEGFMNSLRAKLKDGKTFILSAFAQVHRYIVTDFSTTVISGVLDRYRDYDIVEIVSPEGEYVLGEQYYEFHLYEEALDALILRLFYVPKN